MPIGVLLRDLQRVEWRVHHAHVGTGGLGVEQAAVAAGHAHEVAEAREDDTGLVRDGDAVVEAAHRDHAHRTPGSVHELDVARQQVLDAVLEDGVGVPAAHLHDLPVLVAGLGGDARAERAGEVGVAEFVGELHAGVPVALAVVGTDQLLLHRLPLADLLDLVGVRGPHLLEDAQRLRGLSLTDPAQREAHVHEHVLARLGRVLADQQRGVDPALHTAELDLAVHTILVDVLDEAGGNR